MKIIFSLLHNFRCVSLFLFCGGINLLSGCQSKKVTQPVSVEAAKQEVISSPEQKMEEAAAKFSAGDKEAAVRLAPHNLCTLAHIDRPATHRLILCLRLAD